MTDEPNESTPETDAVSRLLAGARHDEPMPADVVARMDRVLAELAATPAAAPPATPAQDDTVTHLSVHRRRRAAGLLAAAAAIVVGGVVFAQHLPYQGSGSAAETAGGAAASDGDRFSAGNVGPSHASSDSATSGKTTPRATLGGVVNDGRVVVRRRTFSTDALAGQALLARPGQQRLAPPEAACPVPTGDEQVLAALYHRAPAALLYHRPEGSTQVVDLVVCGSDRPIRSVTLPAP